LTAAPLRPRVRSHGALVKEKPEPGLWLEERSIPEIGPGDVLVKLHKTSTYGADIHLSWVDEPLIAERPPSRRHRNPSPRARHSGES
jgi:hypothetical protein